MERFMSMSGFSVLLSFRDDDNDKHPDFSLLSSQDVLKCFFFFMPVMGTGKMTLGDFLLTKTKTFNYGKGDHR